MIKTAVVILNWNGRQFLEKFLPGVINNTVSNDTEVIVADNGSDDDFDRLAVSQPSGAKGHQTGTELGLCRWLQQSPQGGRGRVLYSPQLGCERRKGMV